MNLTSRQVSIIEMLNQKKHISLKNLAEIFSVTERAVRYDVETICMFLGSNILDIRIGEIFITSKKEFDKHYSVLKKELNHYSYKLERKERLNLIILFLLMNANSRFTTQFIADKFSVSRSTIPNDIKDVKTMVDKLNVTLESTSRGISLVSNIEYEIREDLIIFIANLLSEYGHDNLYFSMMKTEISESLPVQLIQREVLYPEFLNLNDVSEKKFKLFETFIYSVINRINKNDTVTDIEYTDKQISQFSVNIINGLQNIKVINLESDLLNNEIIALDNFLKRYIGLGSHIDDLSPEEFNSFETQIKISSFVYAVCFDLNIIDNMEFSTLFSLVKHIQNSLFQADLIVNLQSQNPFTDELFANYPEILKVINYHIYKIESFFKHTFSEEEISYIIMHFAVEVERHANKSIMLNALLVSQSLNSSTQLSKIKLKNELNINVIDTIFPYQLHSYNINKIDLIISTSPNIDTNMSHIKISPLVTNGDISVIRQYIKSEGIYIRKSSNKQDVEIKRIQNYLHQYNEILAMKKDKDITNIQINRLNQEYSLNYDNVGQYNECFWASLNSNRIILNKEVKDWKEAIQVGGEILLINGDVSEDYISSIISNIEKEGPYIVFFPKVAIAHAAPKENVFNTGVSLLILKDPVNFNHEENDPVKFIVTFASVNNQYLDLFYHIAQCMANEVLQTMLSKAQSTSEVINIIKVIENDLFTRV